MVFTHAVFVVCRYNLKPNVRQSLYDYCDQWTRAIGKHRQFMGGNQPNLADLVGGCGFSSVLSLFHVECSEHQEVVSPHTCTQDYRQRLSIG